MRGKSFWILSLVALDAFAWLLVAGYQYSAADVSHDLTLPPFPFCPLKKLTGIPCPGCGGTRAVWLLAHGHLSEALYMNPLTVFLVAFASIAYLWAFIDLIKKHAVVGTLSHHTAP